MDFKVYVERNAMRPWLGDLADEGKLVLVYSPYDKGGRLGYTRSASRRYFLLSVTVTLSCRLVWLPSVNVNWPVVARAQRDTIGRSEVEQGGGNSKTGVPARVPWVRIPRCPCELRPPRPASRGAVWA